MCYYVRKQGAGRRITMAVLKEWFTVDEAAEYLSVSRRTIYKMTQDGRLQTHIISDHRTRRYRKHDLDRVPQPVWKSKNGHATAFIPADPILQELWDNELDAVYDDI